MADIHTVFDKVMENGISGKMIKLMVEDKYEYETARTRLVKLWSVHKELLISIAGKDCDPLLEYSLCGDYEEGYGIFFLGKPRRKKAKSYAFSIIGEDSTGENTGGSIAAMEAVNDELPVSPATATN